MHFTSPATAQRTVKSVFQVAHVYHGVFLLCRVRTPTSFTRMLPSAREFSAMATCGEAEGLPALLFRRAALPGGGGRGGLWEHDGAPIGVGRPGQRAHTCAGRPSGQQKQRGGHLT